MWFFRIRNWPAYEFIRNLSHDSAHVGQSSRDHHRAHWARPTPPPHVFNMILRGFHMILCGFHMILCGFHMVLYVFI